MVPFGIVVAGMIEYDGEQIGMEKCSKLDLLKPGLSCEIYRGELEEYFWPSLHSPGLLLMKIS